MTREEQNAFLSKEYAEAIRYMDNAKETLQKAEKQDNGHYKDEKYVKSACGIAYLGVLRALDAWLNVKGIEFSSKKKQKSIEFYEYTIAQIDKKMLSTLKSAYGALHLSGYYHGVTRISTIKDGFDDAYEIIEKIKPENPIDITETRGDKAKRVWNRMLISLAVMFRYSLK
jgi:tetratricopeptide (TPR) repeat protein